MFNWPDRKKRANRRGIIVALLLLCTFCMPALAEWSPTTRGVKVGIYQNSPKIFLDSNGNPAGFFKDLLTTIAQAEGWTIQYEPCTWGECLQRIESGELDLMADVAYTSEREKRFDFGQEVVFASWSVIYAKAGSNIESILDLDKKRVAVLRDSFQSQTLRKLTESFALATEFIEVPSFEQGYLLVESGKADCIAVNRLFGKLHESTYSARPTNILLAPALVKFAAPKRDNHLLLNTIDRHLIRLKNELNSEYYQAFNHWFEPSKTIRLPSWLKWTLISVTIIILGLILLALIFRRMIRHKTHELEQNKSYLERLSYFDLITELPKRALFIDRIEQAVRKTRQGNPHLAVLFIDLDEFKQINDSVGHEIGDKVLKLAADRLRHCVRNEDTVARLGGDEFTVLIESLHHSELAATIAENILSALRAPFLISEHAFYVTASVGISLFPQDGNSAQALLRNADSAMYKAKEEGRNTFRFYTEDMTNRAVERMSLVAGLREGIGNNEFFLNYQPLLDLESRKIVGIEALLR